MKLLDWLGPIAPSAFIASLLASLVSLLGTAIVWRQRAREIDASLKRHNEQQEQALRQHREKIEADANVQKIHMENALAIHREKIASEFRKDDISRKMEMRREIFTSANTAIGKTIFWTISLTDTTRDVDIRSPLTEEFALAIGKLMVVGGERVVAATYQVMDKWGVMFRAALDMRFGYNAAGLTESQRAFAEANVSLNLALRAELELQIDEDWFRKSALANLEMQLAQIREWLEQVRQRTDSSAAIADP